MRLVARIAGELLLLPVHLYRLLVSPLLGPRCRYHPSCSAYAVEAVREFGPLQGFFVAAWRVLRCNPWSLGGVDPVGAQRLFPLRRHLRGRTDPTAPLG